MIYFTFKFAPEIFNLFFFIRAYANNFIAQKKETVPNGPIIGNLSVNF